MICNINRFIFKLYNQLKDNEDKLGLNIIYLQVKRWENSVLVKEIRDFTEALTSKQARKRIFITTSSFPNSGYEFVNGKHLSC